MGRKIFFCPEEGRISKGGKNVSEANISWNQRETAYRAGDKLPPSKHNTTNPGRPSPLNISITSQRWP